MAVGHQRLFLGEGGWRYPGRHGAVLRPDQAGAGVCRDTCWVEMEVLGDSFKLKETLLGDTAPG